LATLGQGDGKIVVGLGEIRLEADGFAEGGEGFVELAELGQGDSDVGAVRGRFGEQTQGLAEAGQTLCGTAGSHQHFAEIEVSFWAIRLEIQGVAQGADGIVEFARLRESAAAVD
jgi:hypothetical protein